MRGRQRGDTENVHIVFDRLSRRFLGGGEQGPDIDVKADVGKSGGDHLLSAIVPVLSDLGDENAWPPALGVLERIDQRLHLFDPVRHGGRLPPVDAGDGFDFSAVTPENFFERIGDFAYGGFGARRIDSQGQQVAVVFAGATGQRRQRLVDLLLVALVLQARELVDLQAPHRRILYPENLDRGLVDGPEFVDTND